MWSGLSPTPCPHPSRGLLSSSHGPGVSGKGTAWADEDTPAAPGLVWGTCVVGLPVGDEDLADAVAPAESWWIDGGGVAVEFAVELS